MNSKGFNYVIKTAPFGYAFHKIILNNEGNPVDYKFLEVNPAFENLTGLHAIDILNHNVKEVIPAIMNDKFDWVSFYGAIALSGEEKEFEAFSQTLNRWYKVQAYSPEKYYFITIFSDITELKNFQNKIIDAEEKYKALLSANPDLMFVLDKHGVFFDYNSGIINAPVVSPDLFIGKNISEILPGDIALLTQEKLDEIFSTKEIQTYEYQLRDMNESRDFESRLVLYGEDKALSIVRDITDRKRAETTLNESERKFSAFINKLPGMGYRCKFDKEWTMEFVSEGVFGLTGYKPENLINNNQLSYYDVIHPDDRQNVSTIANKAIEKSKPFTLEYRIIDINGVQKWVWENGIMIVGQDGKTEFIEGIILDITDRKQMEEKLAAEKELLSITLHSICDGVITTDTNGNVVIINKVAESLTGWTYSEANNQPINKIYKIICETTRKNLDNPVSIILATGNVLELNNHTILISRSGTESVITYSGAPIKDKNNTIIGAVLVFRDMTENYKMLDTMNRNQKLESLGILAGGIAHDFNNLMCGIFGYIELAAEETKEIQVKKYLGDALNTLDRSRGLTRQLLTFAKGGAPVKKKTTLIPFIKETVQFALSGSNVSCTFQIPDNLWPCNVDKDQIGQVFDNIIINAEQAMPKGGTITISAKNISLENKEHLTLKKGNYVIVSIQDTGTGIPKKILEHIFDPFFTTKAEGNGLGLATCFSIINRHEGIIDVETVIGKGSLFQIYLPATPGKIEEVDITNNYHSGEGLMIVMDDENFIQEILKNILESFGYSVVCTSEGNSALNYFIQETQKGQKIAGVFLDLTVPGNMGGEVIVKEIHKIDDKIPVFVASGYAEDSIMKNPAKYGFTSSICKPFRKNEIIDMLNKHLKS